MSENQTIDRQTKSSSDDGELEVRIADARKLVEGVIGKHKEFFADPDNRLEFLASQSPEGFLNMAGWVNAKLRGEKWKEIRDRDEKGGFLPLLHTPAHEDKPEAFQKGYQEIQEYIRTSTDSAEQKIEGVAMAAEALVIWVHPFNDGNGRTARFMGKLIEDGATDIDDLIAETVAGNARNKAYKTMYPTKESMLASADNTELLFDDDEREDMRKKAETLPSNVEGIAMSVRLLLESHDVRQRTLQRAAKHADLATRVKQKIAGKAAS
ncbi:MAG TPA: Fic family protein [Candidatus Saccharimonadales bacterium]